MSINGKKINVGGIFIVLIIISLALENFKLFTVLGAAFKPIQVVALFAAVFYALFRGVTVKKIVGAIAFLAIPLLPLYRINDQREFFKSYVIYTIIVLFVVFALPHLKEEFCKGFSAYINVYNAVIVVVAVLGIAQFITMNLFGFDFLDGIFGSFLAVSQATDSQGSGFQRAISLFHEPSYFGWVLDIALAVNFVLLKKEKTQKRIFTIAVIIIAILTTLSSSALWLAALIIFIYLASIKKININTVFIVVSLILAIIFAMAAFDLSALTNSMYRLFNEIGQEGSSGYYRLVYPFECVKAVFENFPFFGRGLGQDGDIDIVGKIVGTYGIHNALFGVVAIFGSTSIVYIVWLVKQFFGSKFDKSTRADRILLFASTIGMYATTGAVVSFDTFIFTTIIMLILSVCEPKKEEEKE